MVVTVSPVIFKLFWCGKMYKLQFRKLTSSQLLSLNAKQEVLLKSNFYLPKYQICISERLNYSFYLSVSFSMLVVQKSATIRRQSSGETISSNITTDSGCVVSFSNNESKGRTSLYNRQSQVANMYAKSGVKNRITGISKSSGDVLALRKSIMKKNTESKPLDLEVLKQQQNKLIIQQKQYETYHSRYKNTIEEKKKTWFIKNPNRSNTDKEEELRKGRAKNRLVEALLHISDFEPGSGSGSGGARFNDDDTDDQDWSVDQYSAYNFQSFESLPKPDEQFNSRPHVRSPFVDERYRRIGKYDEDWFIPKIASENQSDNQKIGPEATDISTNICVRVDSIDKLSCDKSDDYDDDDFFDNSVGNETLNEAKISDIILKDIKSEPSSPSHLKIRTESEIFLDKMEESLASAQNSSFGGSMLVDESATYYDSDFDPDASYLPKDENYFGEEARLRFFSLYQRLAKKGAKTVVQSAATDTIPAVGKLDAISRGKSARQLKVKELEVRAELRSTDRHSGGVEDNDGELEVPLDFAAERPMSPRHRYIYLILQEAKVPPLPLIIRHSKQSEELNLAHRALGDDYIRYLSEVVHDLPALTKLNLRDNRLTDRGMGVIIHALAKQRRIVDIDISENKIDSKSAEALIDYLKAPECTLKHLRMSNADLDDDEIAIFMSALEVNQSIIEMDVSHNLLGGSREKSVKRSKSAQAEALTGGAAVALALQRNTTLLDLNLSWNKLGLASSKHLGISLAMNSSLTSINLAYNTIRDEGAEIIGSSLSFNCSLRFLNLSSNGVGPQGMLVIATGVRQCKSLERLDVSGNPIGRQGLAALLQSLNYHSGSRSFSVADCVFDDSGTKTVVDLEYPSTIYLQDGRVNASSKLPLDLSKPSNRALVTELYRLASIKRGVKFKSIDYKAPGKNSKKVSVRLIRPPNSFNLMGMPYAPWKGNIPRDRHPYTLLEASEWMRVVDTLYLIDESTGRKWEVPNEGILTIDCSCIPVVPCPIECLNASGLQRLIALVKDHPQQCVAILSECQNIAMETYQVDEMITSLDDLGLLKPRIDIIANLVACCCDSSNTAALLFKHIPKLDHIKDAQLILRNMFYICVNSISGHYSLDMDVRVDRQTALRLMAISAYENAFIKSATSWGGSHIFTSQQGTKMNFRNETFQNIPIDGGISPSFFANCLKENRHGILEFDFVSITRPHENCQPVGNNSLELALERRGLIYPLCAPTTALLRTRRVALHHLSSLGSKNNGVGVRTSMLTVMDIASDAVADRNSIIVTGCPKTHPFEEILGPNVQTETNRICAGSILPHSINDFCQYAAKSGFACLQQMKREDLVALNEELNLDKSMFFLNNSFYDNKHIVRYTIDISIRIQSSSFEQILEPIALFHRQEDGRLEMVGQDKNEDAKIPLSDILSVDSFSDTFKFEIGLINFINAKNIKPSHKKYSLADDIIVVGSEIFVQLKCNLWSMNKIAKKAINVVSVLFSSLGVTDNHVRVINHKVVESKSNEFPLNFHVFPNCTNHFVVHHVDVALEGIPLDNRFLIKTSSRSLIANNNIVWKWRNVTSRDRGSPKFDLNLSTLEYWGLKVMHLRTLLGGIWITCAQAAFMASRFPQFGNENHPLRESVIVYLFSRVIDLENFHLVVSTLPVTNTGDLYRRVGWLNAINPYEVDFLFTLNLSYADERLMAATLAKFAAVEPGENMLEPRYRRSFDDMFIFGWDLPISWCADPETAKTTEGVPRRGQMITEYCSSAKNNCKKVPWVRQEYLSKYFLMAVPKGNCDDGFEKVIL